MWNAYAYSDVYDDVIADHGRTRREWFEDLHVSH